MSFISILSFSSLLGFLKLRKRGEEALGDVLLNKPVYHRSLQLFALHVILKKVSVWGYTRIHIHLLSRAREREGCIEKCRFSELFTSGISRCTAPSLCVCVCRYSSSPTKRSNSAPCMPPPSCNLSPQAFTESREFKCAPPARALRGHR